jgi:hypothetical protein
VIVAADWMPASSDPDAELRSLVGMAERAVVVTGWRPVLPGKDGMDEGIEHALAFAREHGLETQILSTPVDDDRLRTVVTIATATGRS